jgi:hypothetical protein
VSPLYFKQEVVMNQRQRQKSEDASPARQGRRTRESITIDVACDDRQTQLDVRGCETLSEVRTRALEELGMLASDPERYVVIGSDRQPLDDQRTIDELAAEGQTLAFRFLPQVAYGVWLRRGDCA